MMPSLVWQMRGYRKSLDHFLGSDREVALHSILQVHHSFPNANAECDTTALALVAISRCLVHDVQSVGGRAHEVALKTVQKPLFVLRRVQNCGTALQHSLAVGFQEFQQVVVPHVVDNTHADLMFYLQNR